MRSIVRFWLVADTLSLATITVSENFSVSILVPNPMFKTVRLTGSINTENETAPLEPSQRRISSSARSGVEHIQRAAANAAPLVPQTALMPDPPSYDLTM